MTESLVPQVFSTAQTIPLELPERKPDALPQLHGPITNQVLSRTFRR
jgi:hypothetical protein